MRNYRAKAIQNGVVVAEVSAPTFASAEREIMHYAMMYAQDGPVHVELPRGRKKAVQPAPKLVVCARCDYLNYDNSKTCGICGTAQTAPDAPVERFDDDTRDGTSKEDSKND